MRKVSGWAFWAIIFAAMGSVSLAQVNSKNANESTTQSIQATKDPASMSSTELTSTIKRLDAELFDAYNNCELAKFGSFFPGAPGVLPRPDGRRANAREQLVAAIEQNICGKVHRDLVSIEVYPMKHYGALETGVDRFSHPGIDKDQGDARFVQLWKYEGGRWWLTVVISYDHNEPVSAKR